MELYNDFSNSNADPGFVDTSYSGFADYGDSNVIVDQGGSVTNSNVVNDFFEAARGKLSALMSPPADAKASSTNLGSQVFDAIYTFGRGQVDTARAKIVNAFLGTNEGKKVQREGAKQTLMQYAPFIAVGVVVLLLLGAALRR